MLAAQDGLAREKLETQVGDDAGRGVEAGERNGRGRRSRVRLDAFQEAARRAERMLDDFLGAYAGHLSPAQLEAVRAARRALGRQDAPLMPIEEAGSDASLDARADALAAQFWGDGRGFRQSIFLLDCRDLAAFLAQVPAGAEEDPGPEVRRGEQLKLLLGRFENDLTQGALLALRRRAAEGIASLHAPTMEARLRHATLADFERWRAERSGWSSEAPLLSDDQGGADGAPLRPPDPHG